MSNNFGQFMLETEWLFRLSFQRRVEGRTGRFEWTPQEVKLSYSSTASCWAKTYVTGFIGDKEKSSLVDNPVFSNALELCQYKTLKLLTSFKVARDEDNYYYDLEDIIMIIFFTCCSPRNLYFIISLKFVWNSLDTSALVNGSALFSFVPIFHNPRFLP